MFSSFSQPGSGGACSGPNPPAWCNDCGGPNPPPSCGAVPIDSHIWVLILGGITLGVILFNKKSNALSEPMD